MPFYVKGLSDIPRRRKDNLLYRQKRGKYRRNEGKFQRSKKGEKGEYSSTAWQKAEKSGGEKQMIFRVSPRIDCSICPANSAIFLDETGG